MLRLFQLYRKVNLLYIWLHSVLIVSLPHKPLFPVSSVNSVFLPHIFTLGFSNIPLSIHTLSLRTLIQPQTIKCPPNPVGHTLDIGVSVSPELQADVLSCPLFVPMWMVTTRISSRTPTAKLTLSWVKIILDLSDSAACSPPGLLSFISCSNPHFKHDQLYCPHLCTESEPCGCVLLRLRTCLLIGCLASAWDPTQQEGGFWKVILMLNTVRVIFYSLSSSSWITQNRNLRTLIPLSTPLSLHPFPASSGHCCLLLILKHVSQAPHSVLALVFSSGVCRAQHSAYVQDSFLLFLCI